jgi:hypothetical protein
VINVLCLYAESHLTVVPQPSEVLSNSVQPPETSDIMTDITTLRNHIGELQEMSKLIRNEVSREITVVQPIPETRLLPVNPSHCLQFASIKGSMIVSTFPSFFDSFEGRKWTLLYRGSEHGFRAQNFHERCDGKPNTLTIIQSKEESGFPSRIFGGFTPVRWESEGNTKGEIEGAASFLFNLNPADGSGPRKYPLKINHKNEAIFCRDNAGPSFGIACDLHICDNCNTARSSHVTCGTSYESDGKEENVQFTLSRNFYVQEIEVFELS